MKSIKKLVMLGLVSTLMISAHSVYAVDLPTVKSEGQNLDEFIPEGWSLMKDASIEGDLNQDGVPDIAAIFESKENIMPNAATDTASSASATTENSASNNADAPAASSETAPAETTATTTASSSETAATPIKPRMLVILFGKKEGGYTLSVQANHGVLDNSGGSILENPIAYLKIWRGALHVGYKGGDADKNHWEIVARFRYKDNDWYMMGYNKSNYVAATSQVIKHDYTATTGKMRITTKSLNVNPADDKVKLSTRWEQVKNDKMVKLSSFDPWTVIHVGSETTTAGR